MKLLVVFVLCLATINAMGQDFIGEWRIDWDRTLACLKDSEREKLNGMEKSIRETTELGMKTRKYQIDESGNIQIRWQGGNDEKSSHGSWVWDNETKIFSIIIQAHQRNYKISSLNKLVMEWEIINPNQNGLFTKLVLTR